MIPSFENSFKHLHFFSSLRQRNIFLMIKFQEWPLKVTLSLKWHHKSNHYSANLCLLVNSCCKKPENWNQIMPIRLPFPSPQLLTVAWKKWTNLARCSYLCNNKYVQGKGWGLNFTENYLGLIPMYILSQFQKKRNAQTPFKEKNMVPNPSVLI